MENQTVTAIVPVRNKQMDKLLGSYFYHMGMRYPEKLAKRYSPDAEFLVFAIKDRDKNVNKINNNIRSCLDKMRVVDPSLAEDLERLGAEILRSDA